MSKEFSLRRLTDGVLGGKVGLLDARGAVRVDIRTWSATSLNFPPLRPVNPTIVARLCLAAMRLCKHPSHSSIQRLFRHLTIQSLWGIHRQFAAPRQHHSRRSQSDGWTLQVVAKARVMLQPPEGGAGQDLGSQPLGPQRLQLDDGRRAVGRVVAGVAGLGGPRKVPGPPYF
jgi:hypothetical protein